MTRRNSMLWSALVGAAAATGVFFAGMYAVRATTGGETRRALSFTGTLTGRTGPQTLVFTFHKGTSTVCAPSATATPDPSTGAVAVEIPLASCPTTLFDGADVTYDVSVGGTVLSPSQPINPVPYAAYADRVGTPDCPNSYERFTEASMPSGAIYCRKGRDEVVRVGAGHTAFWIDRYLASIWSNSDGTGTQYDGRTATVSASGNFTTPSYAASVAGVSSAGYVTWAQANALCRLAGKRIPQLEELYFASAGGPCFGVTSAVDQCPRGRMLDYNTDATPACISAAGATQLCGYRYQWTSSVYFMDGSSGSTVGVAAHVFGYTAAPPPTPQFLSYGYSAGGTAPTPSEYHGFRCVLGR